VEENIGPITDVEVLKVLERRGANQEWSRKKTLPSERKAILRCSVLYCTVALAQLTVVILLASVGLIYFFVSIQAYSYLLQKHPHSPTREELQAFFDDLKASTAMPSHRLDNK
jgi:hypothetical protein